MTKEQISDILYAQRKYFRSGKTLPVEARIKALKALRDAIRKHEKKISDAIFTDLGKCETEAFMCEVGLVLGEITHMLRHIRKYTKEKRVATPLVHFASRSYTKSVPLGNTLIMSPWNYPFLLTFSPLVNAIAAGNTALVKPSAYSKETSRVIGEIIREVFPPEYVAFISGGREENMYLLDERFDFVFFTGSRGVGECVMQKAARFLTPVTLELGGKSPCIVDASADIPLTARRIVWGKFLNCGQTCVAPDYILCENSVRDALIKALRVEIEKQYPSLDDCGKIINKKHFERLQGLIDQHKVVIGGVTDESRLKIYPTVMDNVTLSDSVMGEEIFGPILPIVGYDKLDDAIEIIESFDRPLALYMFSKNKNDIKEVTATVRFGGGCINDTVIHLATSNMGFGGVGESGMGAYHGEAGFDAFSHKKSIVDKKTYLDLPMRYRPFKSLYEKIIRMVLK